MATEKNPYDQIPQEVSNVVPMAPAEETDMNATFQVEDDGGVTVNFEDEEAIMQPSEEIAEWYGDLSETLDEDELFSIAIDTIENYQADKDSRGEWESMFERGFELLGLKLEPGSEPVEGAGTAVHPLLLESAVKFQAKASGDLFPSSGPVTTTLLGKSTTDKAVQAERVQN